MRYELQVFSVVYRHMIAERDYSQSNLHDQNNTISQVQNTGVATFINLLQFHKV